MSLGSPYLCLRWQTCEAPRQRPPVCERRRKIFGEKVVCVESCHAERLGEARRRRHEAAKAVGTRVRG